MTTTQCRPRYLSIGVVCTALLLTFTPDATAQQWEDAYPGVRYLAETRPGPVEVRAVEVDLCASGVSLRATSESENWQTASSFGSQVGAQVAINGDFYEWPPDTLGLAVGDGDYWSPDRADWGFIAFGPERAEITEPGTHVPDPPGWIEDAVGGNIMVLTDGVTTNDQGDFCTTRHPRTVVGLSSDGTKLYLVVADGRNPGTSIGMTCAELGDLMSYLGAQDALNLDGGGSTTMWRQGAGVVNQPSDADGERNVVNHLAVHASGSGGAHSCPQQDWDVGIDTRFPDLDVIHSDGEAADFPDVFVGDEFIGELWITNNSDNVIRDVWAGYWFEHPYLEGLDARIYSDHPEYDQQSWEINDADEAPENPDAGDFGQEGHLNLHAFSPGETKRIVFDMQASQYSIGMADHPDLRGWVRSIEDIYGDQDGFWDDPDEVNLVEEHLRAFSELDVISRDHWHFAADDEEQLEGWRRCDGSSDAMAIDTEEQALAIASNDDSICLRAPQWSVFDTDSFDSVVVQLAEGSMPEEWTLQWESPQQGAQSFVIDDAAGQDAIVFPLSDVDGWGGMVEDLEFIVDSDAILIDAVFAQSADAAVSTPYAEAISGAEALPVDDPGGDHGGDDDVGLPGGPDAGDGGDTSGDDSANGEGIDDSMSTSSCSSTPTDPASPLWLMPLLVAFVAIRSFSSLTGR